MRFHIRHNAVLTYPSSVRSVIMALRRTPRGHEGQHIASWRIDLDVDCLLSAAEDAFGNIAHTFNAEGSLRSIGVLVEGEVETFDTAGIVRGAPERFPPQLYLRETPLTAADAELRTFAVRAASLRDGALDILHGLRNAVHATLAFDATSADTGTTAAEALARKRGDGRDFAQVFIACARHLDIPARYVSGIFLPAEGNVDEARDHAWAEAFVSEIGWIAFDAVNDTCPQEAHVRIASGLDYLGAAPVRAACSDGIGDAPTMTVRAERKHDRRQSQSQRQS